MVDAAVAAAPVALTIILLVTRLPAWAPPVAGIAAASAVSLFVLGGSVGDLAGAAAGSWGTLVKVAAIIGAGALLARVMHHTGAQGTIATWLSSGGTSVATALLMTHGVVPFIESVTGFGVTILIGLPLMLACGFSPLPAATMVLLGLTVSPWGSMGPGTLLASEFAGSSLRDMGVASALLSLPVFLVSGIFIAVIAAHDSSATERAGSVRLSRRLRWAATGTGSALLLWGCISAANWTLGTPVAGAAGSAVVAVFWLVIVRGGQLLPAPGASLLPYAVLVLGTVAGQSVASQIDVAPVAAVLESPALWALAGAVTGVLVFTPDSRIRVALSIEAGSMLLQVGVPTTLYVVFGTVMGAGGPADALAKALTGMGMGYLAVSPFLAALSGYITASATGANAMFGTTQVAAAHALDVSPFWMMATQNVAAGWAVAASPARIELAYRMIASNHRQAGGSGPPPTRSDLLKTMVPAVLSATALCGALSLLILT
jgi:lactate permease